MAEDDVKIGITADDNPFKAGLARVEQAAKQTTDKVKSAFEGITSSFEKVQSGLLGLTAALAGGAGLKEIIDATKEWIENSIQMGIQLGISASEASDYATAIALVGGTTDDFTAASRGLARQLKTHEEALNQLGVKTRDVNGNLLAGNVVLQNAINVVNSYKEGIDRTMAAQEIFGRSVTDTNAIFRLSKTDIDEAKKSNDELSLTVGERAREAFEENRKATAEATKTMQGLGKAVGDALMPILTQLAEWFRSAGPEAIDMLRAALALLLTPIWGIIESFNILLDVGKFVTDSLATLFAGLANAAKHAATGSFSQAKDDLKGIASGIATDWKNLWDSIVADSTKARANIVALWSKDDAIGPKKDGKSYQAPAENKGDNRLALFKNELQQMEQAEGDFDGKDLAMQLQFWQSKLLATKAGTEADKKLRTEIEKEILGLTKKTHDEDIKSQQEYVKQVLAVQENLLAAKKANLQQQLALGNITQTEELEGEKQLEDQLYAVREKALQDKIALAKFDMLAQQQIRDQEILLEQQHAAAIQAIVNKEALDQHKVWDDLNKSIESGFQGVIANFMKGTTTMSQFVHQMFTSVATSVGSILAQLAAKNLATMVTQAAAGKAIRAKEIMGDASKAASGAYSAVAAIPYVGPFLAPAAAVAAYVATAAFVSSAEGGYDIPAGVNPLTQLHQREMVIPAPIADGFRKIIAGGGANPMGDDSGGGDAHIHFHGIPMGNDHWMAHQNDLVRVFKDAFRKGKLS